MKKKKQRIIKSNLKFFLQICRARQSSALFIYIQRPSQTLRSAGGLESSLTRHKLPLTCLISILKPQNSESVERFQ